VNLTIDEKEELEAIAFDVTKLGALKRVLELLTIKEENRFLSTQIDDDNPSRVIHEKCRLEGFRKFRMLFERELNSFKKQEKKRK